MPSPLIGATAGSALTAVVVAVVFGASLEAGAQPVKHCPAAQIRKSISYVQRKGGRTHHASGCVPRSVTRPTSVAAALSSVRSIAAGLIPARTARALRGGAARRVLSADAATDAALAAATKPSRRAHAATVTHESDTTLVDGPPGTRTTQTRERTTWDADEPQEGFEATVTTATTSNRIAGLSSTKRKTTKIKVLLDSCPDAAGVAHGTASYSEHERQVIATPGGGQAVLDQLSTFHGTIAAHVGDDAHIASVEVTGDWSFSQSGRVVRGSVSSSNFRQSNGGDYLDLNAAVTTASDDGVAVSGRYLGLYVTAVPGLFIQDALNVLQRHLLGGRCVAIVPDATTVHVVPGGTVPIGAHLEDRHHATFSGPIDAATVAGRVDPSRLDAAPHAVFVYAAAATPPAGGTDVVVLRHVSRHGVGNPATVTVVYDKRRFPARFDGSWTRTITMPASRPGWTETVHGTGAYVRNPAFPVEAEGTSSVPYEVENVNITWSVSGTMSSGPCTTTYSGSGSESSATDSGLAGSRLTLEDVTTNPYAPHPEPSPYYYSVRSSSQSEPTFHIHVDGAPGCASDTDSPIVVDYLHIGYASNYTADTPPDQVEKSADITLLQGQRSQPEGSGPATDDSWSFTGSG